MIIYPAILSSSLSEVKTQVQIAQELTEVDTIQIDIIDGFFVDNITISPLDLVEVEFGELKCDVHLMVDEPMDFVFELEGVASHIPVRAVIGQVEHMSYPASFLEEVKQQGWKAGLALDLFTPLEEIEELDWSQLDIIQVMGNQAGWQHEPLHPLAIKKLKEVAELAEQRSWTGEILVDIGVNEKTIASLKKAGATGCAVGSALWESLDPSQLVGQLQSV